MALLEIDWNPPLKKLRLFGGVWFPLLLICIGMVLFTRFDRISNGMLLGGIAVVISTLAWIQPRMIRPVYIGWMAVTFPLGWIVSHLMLALIFFGVVTPIGYLLRMFGHDPLHLRGTAEETSLWWRRSTPGNIERYFKQF